MWEKERRRKREREIKRERRECRVFGTKIKPPPALLAGPSHPPLALALFCTCVIVDVGRNKNGVFFSTKIKHSSLYPVNVPVIVITTLYLPFATREEGNLFEPCRRFLQICLS